MLDVVIRRGMVVTPGGVAPEDVGIEGEKNTAVAAPCGWCSIDFPQASSS